MLFLLNCVNKKRRREIPQKESDHNPCRVCLPYNSQHAQGEDPEKDPHGTPPSIKFGQTILVAVFISSILSGLREYDLINLNPHLRSAILFKV